METVSRVAEVAEIISIQMKDAVISMELIYLESNDSRDSNGMEQCILALDLSNAFYIISAVTGDILLINDTASKLGPTASIGTYCDIIVCLTSLSSQGQDTNQS